MNSNITKDNIPSNDQSDQKQSLYTSKSLKGVTTMTSALANIDDVRVPPPEYLKLAEAHDSKLFDRTMHNVGVSYLYALGAGLGVGTIEGLVYGAKGSLRIRANAVLNAWGKRGIKGANYFCVAVIYYHCFDLFLNYLSNKEHTDVVGVASGTLAGVLFQSNKSLRRIRLGGAVGFAASLAHGIYQGTITKKSIPPSIRALLDGSNDKSIPETLATNNISNNLSRQPLSVQSEQLEPFENKKQ